MKKFLLPIAVVLLSACSATDLPEVFDVLTSHELTSFDVVGTDVDTAQGQAPINPNVKNGEIHVKWTVREQLQNTIKLVVSNDNSLSNDDVKIFFSICNLATSCGQVNVDQLCTFSTSNDMDCSFDNTSLTNFLSGGIPKDAFIIIESCLNANPLLCDTRSDMVQFQ